MLVKNKKKKKSSKKFPIRVYGYLDRSFRARVLDVSLKTGKSVSSLIREGLSIVCEKYER